MSLVLQIVVATPLVAFTVLRIGSWLGQWVETNYAQLEPLCECSRPVQACSCDQSPTDWPSDE